jgi:hypothetical protein
MLYPGTKFYLYPTNVFVPRKEGMGQTDEWMAWMWERLERLGERMREIEGTPMARWLGWTNESGESTKNPG